MNSKHPPGDPTGCPMRRVRIVHIRRAPGAVAEESGAPPARGWSAEALAVLDFVALLLALGVLAAMWWWTGGALDTSRMLW